MHGRCSKWWLVWVLAWHCAAEVGRAQAGSGQGVGLGITPGSGVASGVSSQDLERTCFQAYHGYAGFIHLPADVAIVYGIDPGLAGRIKGWREQGYRIHVMTGVSWGHYQDYLYGKFDGINHEDEAQTDRWGNKISHGGDVYYMSPGTNYGNYLCVGVKRALDAGAEAIHLEEPEFWVRSGYSEGFKREWKAYYHEDWTPPDSSVDAQWRSSMLKYFLYRRALQQVFNFVGDYNRARGTQVRCYVPTHSLLNYAHWRIVSPESSLARLAGCDGYIAQVWTGTSRTPNVYRGKTAERTFETAFLEYGAVQNLVRSTGRRVWYLNDPIEDNPSHDWGDYQRNWESTLVASLFQPEVWRYEVMPWPDRVFGASYPSAKDPSRRDAIPPAYATELQTVMGALNDMNQKAVEWEGGERRAGVVVGDSLMFERGEPAGSDPHMSHFYGLALPLLKHGIPVEPVQMENFTLPDFLVRQDLLLMSYQGMKPPGPEAHRALAEWVRGGGVLIFWDDDSDPYNGVREWWNSGALRFKTPRAHLFKQLGLSEEAGPGRHAVGKGAVWFQPSNPAALAYDPQGDESLLNVAREAAQGSRLRWRESNHLMLRRGNYVIAAGLDEGLGAEPERLAGKWVNLFDASLSLQTSVTLAPGSRYLLLDVDPRADASSPKLLASACGLAFHRSDGAGFHWVTRGIDQTEGIALLRWPAPPARVTLDGADLKNVQYDAGSRLLWIRFPNAARPRELIVQ